MKLLIGLGNPGLRYASTRHNAGFRVLDRFAADRCIPLDTRRFEGRYGEGRVGDADVALLAPQTFMNNSGEAVAEAVEGLGIESVETDLIVVYDDMDTPLGRLRLRKGGGAGGQNGIGDVIYRLGTSRIPRIRFGVGRPPAGQDPVDYVLSDFAPQELPAIGEAVAQASAALQVFAQEGIEAAMNRFNAAADPDCPD